MKKLLPLLILPAVIFLFNCKKNNQATQSLSITGKWNAVADTTYWYKNGTLNVTNNYDLQQTPFIMQFNADGTGNQTNLANKGTVELTYSLIDNTVTRGILTPADQFGGTSPGNTTKYNITSLTQNNLKLTYDHSSVTNGTTYRVVEKVYMNR